MNREVISYISSSTQGAEEATSKTTLSPLEQAGGFEIEHDIPLDGEDSLKGANARGFSAFSSGDRADMMSNIENPMPASMRMEHKPEPATPAPIAPKSATTMTEPLVDQLLRAAGVPPTARTEGKIDHAPLQAPKPPARAPQPPVNLPTSDPYREGTK